MLPCNQQEPPRTKAPLQQEYPVSIVTSRRLSTKKNTKNRRTPQTTQSMGRSFYRHKSHRTRHIQAHNWRWKRSQQYMAHQSATKILCMKTTQGKICIQDTRDQRSWSTKIALNKTFMINKDSAQQKHMYHCDISIFMINKDDSFSTNICLIMAFPELFL